MLAAEYCGFFLCFKVGKFRGNCIIKQHFKFRGNDIKLHFKFWGNDIKWRFKFRGNDIKRCFKFRGNDIKRHFKFAGNEKMIYICSAKNAVNYGE